MIGAARIATSTAGTYQPDPAGRWAAILAVDDRFGELVDLVSWLPENPSRWWLRVGDETPILGARALAFAADCGKRIRLWSTPERWLREGGAGRLHQDVCILHWDVDLWPLFDGVGTVECDCVSLQARFLNALRQWEPEIVVVVLANAA